MLRSLLLRRLPPPSYHHFHPIIPFSRFFSSLTQTQTPDPNTLQIAQSLSTELTKHNPDDQTIPLTQNLDLSFTHITLTPTIIHQTLNLSPLAGRTSLNFLKWVSSKPGFELADQVLALFIDYLGRRHDFKAAHEVLVEYKGLADEKCFEKATERLVRVGRANMAVGLFENMEMEYGFVRSLDKLKFVVANMRLLFNHSI